MGVLPCCSIKNKNRKEDENAYIKGDLMNDTDKAAFNDFKNFIDKTTNNNNKNSSDVKQLNISNPEKNNSWNNNYDTKNMNNKINNINNNIKITNNIYFTNYDKDNQANPKENSLSNENYNVIIDNHQNNVKGLSNNADNMNYSGNEIFGGFAHNTDILNNKNKMIITNQLYESNNSKGINY